MSCGGEGLSKSLKEIDERGKMVQEGGFQWGGEGKTEQKFKAGVLVRGGREEKGIKRGTRKYLIKL